MDGGNSIVPGKTEGEMVIRGGKPQERGPLLSPVKKRVPEDHGLEYWIV